MLIGLIALATVYTNNHYAADAVVGLALALVIWVLVRHKSSGQVRKGKLSQLILGSAGIAVGSQMGASCPEEMP